MTVKELKEELAKYPDDMEVVYDTFDTNYVKIGIVYCINGFLIIE